MKRIDTSTSVDGRFVDGDKISGRRATQFSAGWCNAIQEEISNLIESAGIALDGSEDQLKRIFTVLFILELSAKSCTFRKSFEGGYSDIVINGENINLDANGSSVDDNSNVNLSRLLMSFTKTQGGGTSKVEIRPDSIKVMYTTGVDETIITEIDYDQIKTIKLVGQTAVSEHGRKLIVDSTLEIGGVAGSQNGENIVVNGDSTLKKRASVGRLKLDSGSAYIVTGNDLLLTSLFVTSSSTILPEEGDVVVVRNSSNSNIKITLQYDVVENVRKARIVEIYPECSMAFVCSGSYHDSAQVVPNLDYYRWSPLQNVTITWEVPST